MNVDAELIVLPYEARQGRHLLDRLIDELESGRWSEFRAAVAFASKSANIPALIDALEDFAAAGHTVTITFCARRFSGGTYATDFEAVEPLVEIFEGHPDARIFLYSQHDITFHPKLYMFGNASSARLIVGSSNWSESGLVRNVEANVALTLDLNDDQACRTYDRVTEYYDRYWTGRVTTMDDGEGFAEEVTRENIEQFEPLLRMPGETDGSAADPTTSRSADENEDDPVDSMPDDLFDGEPFRVEMGRERAPGARASGPGTPLTTASSGIVSFVLGPLGRRDTRQETGFSREIYIPLRARDSHSDFWAWPDAFTPDDPTDPTYVERRVNIRIYPVSGGSPVVDDVRLFHYEDRSEFRLNSGALIEGASPGDVLVVNRTPEEGSVDYEAKIISSGDSRHSALLTQCTESVPNSPKGFGYRSSTVSLP